jgi:hypothetical protein
MALIVVIAVAPVQRLLRRLGWPGWATALVVVVVLVVDALGPERRHDAASAGVGRSGPRSSARGRRHHSAGLGIGPLASQLGAVTNVRGARRAQPRSGRHGRRPGPAGTGRNLVPPAWLQAMRPGARRHESTSNRGRRRASARREAGSWSWSEPFALTCRWSTRPSTTRAPRPRPAARGRPVRRLCPQGCAVMLPGNLAGLDGRTRRPRPRRRARLLERAAVVPPPITPTRSGLPPASTHSANFDSCGVNNPAAVAIRT